MFLFYFTAVFQLLYSGGYVFGLAIGFGLVGAGLGIANEYKWGYVLGLVMSALVLLRTLIITPIPILTLMFDVALVALLVHPQSRDYQRIWFK